MVEKKLLERAKFVFSVISIVLFSGCRKEYALKDFINQIAPGYTPFEKRYFDEQN